MCLPMRAMASFCGRFVLCWKDVVGDMNRERIVLKNQEQLRKMRAAGQLVAETFAMLAEHVKPGITTGELDAIAEAFIRRHGAVPSFKGYRGFPGSICVAVNDVVVHGIPGDQQLEEGDIIAIDIGARLDGWHGDACMTFAVGEVDEDSIRLMAACRASLDAGIEQARAGNRLTDVAAAVQQVVEDAGYEVVRDLFAHGVGRRLHESPTYPHYGRPGRGPALRPGMVFTIEPMIVAGRREVEILDDGWTIITRDGSRSAQYEHTVAITENGAWILTLP